MVGVTVEPNLQLDASTWPAAFFSTWAREQLYPQETLPNNQLTELGVFCFGQRTGKHWGWDERGGCREVEAAAAAQHFSHLGRTQISWSATQTPLGSSPTPHGRCRRVNSFSYYCFRSLATYFLVRNLLDKSWGIPLQQILELRRSLWMTNMLKLWPHSRDY